MTQQNTQFNTQIDPADIEANKVVSGFAYFGILFFLPLVVAPESKYGRFHANQGLLLLILAVGLGIVMGILSAIFFAMWVPVLWAIYSIISFIVWVGFTVLAIMGMVNGFTGKVKGLPVIGKIQLIK